MHQSHHSHNLSLKAAAIPGYGMLNPAGLRQVSDYVTDLPVVKSSSSSQTCSKPGRWPGFKPVSSRIEVGIMEFGLNMLQNNNALVTCRIYGLITQTVIVIVTVCSELTPSIELTIIAVVRVLAVMYNSIRKRWVHNREIRDKANSVNFRWLWKTIRYGNAKRMLKWGWYSELNLYRTWPNGKMDKKLN